MSRKDIIKDEAYLLHLGLVFGEAALRLQSNSWSSQEPSPGKDQPSSAAQSRGLWVGRFHLKEEVGCGGYFVDISNIGVPLGAHLSSLTEITVGLNLSPDIPRESTAGCTLSFVSLDSPSSVPCSVPPGPALILQPVPVWSLSSV